MSAKVVAVVSQKGGVGKSTICTNMAVMAADAGLRVLAVDLDDVQRTSASWLEGRRDAGIGQAPVDVVRASAPDMPRLMQASAPQYDLILIDTKASADGPAMAAVRHAGLVLMPTRPDAIFDLTACRATIEMTQAEGKPAAVVFSLVSPRRLELADETRQGLEGQGVTVCPHQLADRAAVKDSAGFGLALHEHAPKDRATKEMAALFQWVVQQVGLQVAAPITKARKAAA